MANTKKYLKCTVTPNVGKVFENPLKLSEAYMISQLAQENNNVLVKFVETDESTYNFIFGK